MTTKSKHLERKALYDTKNWFVVLPGVSYLFITAWKLHAKLIIAGWVLAYLDKKENKSIFPNIKKLIICYQRD